MHAPLSAPRFLLAALLIAAGGFGLVWLWVAAAPLAYLDPEYPAWRAKQELLFRCDLGDVLILGDSRAAADVIPAELPVKATNLAVGGGEAIEAYVALKRALRCPRPPRRVIISLDVVHFMRPDLFWERTVRFGFLGRRDVDQVARVAGALGDWAAFNARQTDGLPAGLRARLYGVRFPPLYFNSLVKGGGFLRWWQNRRLLREALAARGHYYFGTAPGSATVAVDAHLPAFRPLPVLDWYFDRLLALLADRGIPADFIAMPMNEATWRQVDPGFRTAFAAYLDGYARRYPGFHVVGPVMPYWPDRYFGDGFAHLNPEGATRFSAGLAHCLQVRLAGGGAEDCEAATLLTATAAAP
jgi:hypothetical protein